MNVLAKISYTKKLLVSSLLLLSLPAFAGDIGLCINNKTLQEIRSSEIKKLKNEDQQDRQNYTLNNSVAVKDLKRRKRIGEIFGEGCITTPEDYFAAALIYQHGVNSDHYLQAYLWSKRAGEMGHPGGYQLSAAAIDRYLVSKGKKQLFGTQYYKNQDSKCFCIQPVEPAFTDRLRKKYSDRSLADNYNILKSINSAECEIQTCTIKLAPTIRGSVWGIW